MTSHHRTEQVSFGKSPVAHHWSISKDAAKIKLLEERAKHARFRIVLALISTTNGRTTGVGDQQQRFINSTTAPSFIWISGQPQHVEIQGSACVQAA